MTFLLTKIFLKSSIQKMGEQYDISKKKGRGVKIVLYGFLLLYLLGVIGLLSYSLIDGLKEIQQETIFIGLVLLLVLGVTVIQTIFSSINLLYFTKDTDSILPLPLKPYQIIWARTNVIIIVEFLINILVGLVPLIIYGIILDCGVMYYLSVIFAVLLLPVLPIILVSLLVMIIMSFAKITKNKNRFQLIVTILVIVIVIAFSTLVSRMGQNTMSDEQLIQMMTQANGMVSMIKGYFPTFEFAINAITSSSILTTIIEFAKLIGVTAIGFAIYLLLAQKLYFKGLIGNLYSGIKGKKFSGVNTKRTTLGRMYVAKEFKILLRNPVFLVQCVLPALIFPVLCIFLTFVGLENEDMQELSSLTSMLEANKIVLLLGILGVIEFFTMIVYVSATAISRDGENAVFMKYIPVPLYKQYVYKTMPNIIMNLISIVIVLGIAKYLINVSLIDLILLLIVAMVMAIFQSFLLLLIDLKRPKLKWSSEYAVVKQNMNLMFPMIFAFVNIGIIVLFGILMQNMSAYIPLALLGVIFAIASILLCRYLKTHQYELARKIV